MNKTIKLTATFYKQYLLLLTLSALALNSYAQNNEQFKAYWHQGKAEITSYTLSQARYGELHTGSAVLIFVTEDFSAKKQVKLDNPAAAGTDRIPVMKLNLTKKFTTGIYPYSMMRSVFTPIALSQDNPTLKVTISSQEWCGNTFSQFNRTKTGYDFEVRSYFESEGDQSGQLKSAMLEDQIWTQIRLDPNTLPLGKIQLMPGTFYQRLRHTTVQIENAVATQTKNDNHTTTYTLNYPNLKRTLSITFNQVFPYEITDWQERYTSGWGKSAKVLTTTATKKKTIMQDYWNKHSVKDGHYRNDLEL